MSQTLKTLALHNGEGTAAAFCAGTLPVPFVSQRDILLCLLQGHHSGCSTSLLPFCTQISLTKMVPHLPEHGNRTMCACDLSRMNKNTFSYLPPGGCRDGGWLRWDSLRQVPSLSASLPKHGRCCFIVEKKETNPLPVLESLLSGAGMTFGLPSFMSECMVSLGSFQVGYLSVLTRSPHQ